MIAALHVQNPAWSVRFLCRSPGVARSSYAYQSQRDRAPDLALHDALEAIAVEFPRYGYRRITVDLGRRGVVANHKHVLAIMRAANLLVQGKRYCQTTDSTHGHPPFPNLVRGMVIVRPDQVWCADITYIRLPREFVYLAVLLDVFTRAFRGWELAADLTEALPLAALDRALTQRCPEFHHSDQGVQ
jgi:putative transposase